MRTIAELEAERAAMLDRAAADPRGAPLYIECAKSCARQITAMRKRALRNARIDPDLHCIAVLSDT
jgi:hypothetical protein